MVRIIKAKVLIKVPLRAKINSPPTGHSILVLLKAFPKIFQGPPPKAPPRVLIKASLTVKVLLLLPYSHLPPTPHILAVHKICIFHLLSNTSPAASLGILSGSQYGSSFFSALDSIPFRRVLPYPWIPPFPSPPLLLSPLCTGPVFSLTSPYLSSVRLALTFLSPLALLPLFAPPLYSLPSLPLLLSPASSLPLKVFAQRGSAQSGSTLRSSHPKGSLAAMLGAFRVGAAYDLQLSSCAFPMCRLRPWCQLCRWMLWATCTLLILGTLLTT